MSESMQCIDHGTPIGSTIFSEQGRITPYELGAYTVKKSAHIFNAQYLPALSRMRGSDHNAGWYSTLDRA